MPFDSTQFDYTKVQPVYDRENPPKRMSEAIRMAVADVEAQERAGIEYDWWNCAICTAGAVVLRLCGRVSPDWDEFGREWYSVLESLSILTAQDSQNRGGAALCAYTNSPSLFAVEPERTEEAIADFAESPEQFKTDMLALADRLEAEGS